MFHFEISGIISNEEHPLNNPEILLTLEIFHFDISGNFSNDEHPANISIKLNL